MPNMRDARGAPRGLWTQQPILQQDHVESRLQQLQRAIIIIFVNHTLNADSRLQRLQRAGSISAN